MFTLLAIQTAILLVVLLALYGAGVFVTWRVRFESRSELAVTRFGWGTIVLSTAFVLLGLAGRLTPGWWAPLVLVALAAGALSFEQRLPAAAGGEMLLLLLAAFATAPLLFLSAFPPIWFDETLYHLPTVQRFAEAGSLPFIAHLRAPVFPHLQEVLSVPLYQLAGARASHLISVAAVLVTTWALIAAGLRWWNRSVAAVAVAGLLASPLVVFIGSTSYIDALLMMFVALMFFSFERWRESDSRFWLVSVGALGGAAASVKYLGLFWVGIVGLFVVFFVLRDRRAVTRVLLFAAAGFGVMALWYGRIVWYTGNPLFPYLTTLFGESPWHGLVPPGRPLLDYVITIVRLPWDITRGGVRIGYQPPLAPIGLAIPFVIAAAFSSRKIRWIIAIVFAWVLVWCRLPQDARYFAPALPLVALAMAIALAPLAEKLLPKYGVPLLAVFMLTPGLYWARYRVYDWGMPPADPQATQALLDRHVVGHAAVSFLNRVAAEGDVVVGLGGENVAWYYERGTWMGDHSGPASYGQMFDATTPLELRNRLRAHGAKWFVISSPLKVSVTARPEASRWFERVYVDGDSTVYKLLE